MKKLLVATGNASKLKEIRDILSGTVQEVVSLADYPHNPATIEDGITFADNALKKAREACSWSGLPVIADDSGLVVDALEGRPGVYSARYAGENADDDSNNIKLIHELQGIPIEQRNAAFICVIAMVIPEGDEQLFTGKIDGFIIDEPRGKDGFGYDPLFVVGNLGRTMAELSLQDKNAISHRGQALMQLKSYLEQRLS